MCEEQLTAGSHLGDDGPDQGQRDPQRRVVKMKAFKLKEDITIFADESQSTPLINIRARSVIDVSASYDVVDLTTSEKVGVLRRKGMRSLLRDEWEILDRNEQKIGSITEDSMMLALVRRFLSNLVP